jgi:hypothetical protein
MVAKITTTKGEFRELLKESLNTLAKEGNPELKAMIKSCIKEVLMESGGLPLPPQNPYMNPYMQPQNPYMQPQNPYMQPQGSYVQPQNPYMQIAQNTAAQIAKGDPVQAKLFEKILADTAQTSLQDTLEYERNGSTQQQRILDQQQMSKFGTKNIKGRWAELAFNTQPTVMPPGALLG